MTGAFASTLLTLVVVPLVHFLVEKRQQARANKDWAEADRIRDELAAEGVVIEDTAEGARWRRR